MESSSSSSSSRGTERNGRVALSEVVADCVKRWFRDTLKEAKAGDINMQVLVSQMYYNGYGVLRDAQQGRLWLTKASRVRSSVWKIGEKRPGIPIHLDSSQPPWMVLSLAILYLVSDLCIIFGFFIDISYQREEEIYNMLFKG
ncbi:hypothetical protein Lal_00012208 [Lupinus albus]|nr:hypothetical protein Lal_00012208 [Lupinus albus]